MNCSVVAVILGGGRGTRLNPPTKHRSKPTVPIAGKYRLVDIPISNCLNSDIQKIFVLTQFNSASLNRYFMETYNFDGFSNGFVDIFDVDSRIGYDFRIVSGHHLEDGEYDGHFVVDGIVIIPNGQIISNENSI